MKYMLVDCIQGCGADKFLGDFDSVFSFGKNVVSNYDSGSKHPDGKHPDGSSRG